jgi:hypothetical protein
MIISCYSSTRVPLLTWINDIPPTIDYVVLRGDMKLHDDYVYNSESHECILRCPDTYLGLPHKIKAGLQFIYKQFKPSFVVKIDDDVLVNIPKLIQYIESTRDDYAGVVTYNYCPGKNLKSVYCGGPVYYLSSRALTCLQDMDATFSSSEDTNIGAHLIEKCNLPVHNIHLYTDDFHQKDSYIAYHDHERVVFSVKAPTHAISMPSPAYKLSFMRHLSQKNNFNTSHPA